MSSMTRSNGTSPSGFSIRGRSGGKATPLSNQSAGTDCDPCRDRRVRSARNELFRSLLIERNHGQEDDLRQRPDRSNNRRERRRDRDDPIRRRSTRPGSAGCQRKRSSRSRRQRDQTSSQRQKAQGLGLLDDISPAPPRQPTPGPRQGPLIAAMMPSP